MAEDALFGRDRGQGGRGPDEFEVAVDEVLSRAVERQLEEQREFNRLVARTTDRLGALESGLRSWGERTATALTELRRELEQQARLGEEVANLAEQLRAGPETPTTEELVGLLDRFEEGLASRVDDRVDALSHRLTRLQEQVDPSALTAAVEVLHRRLDGLDELRDHVDRLGELPGRLSRLEEELAGAAATGRERHAELLDEVGAGLRRALLPVADDLADLREQLVLLRGRAAEDEQRSERLREALTGTVEARLDAVQRALEEAAQQREELAAGLRGTREAAAEHRDAIDATLRAGRRELEARIGGVLEAVETRLDDVSRVLGTTLPAHLGAQRDELTGEVERALQQVSERVTAAHDELRAITGELAALPAEVEERVSTGLERVEGRVATGLDRLEGHLDRVEAVAHDEADTVTREVTAAVDRLDAVQQRLDRLESSLVTYLEARDARLEEERVRVLRDLVEDFARGLSRRQRRKLARRLDDARERVAPAPPSAPPPRPPGDAASGPGPGPEGERTGPAPGSLLAELIGEDADHGLDGTGTTSTGAAGRPSEEQAPPTATEPGPDEEEPATEGHVCPECGFVAGNAGGLGSHRRTHRR